MDEALHAVRGLDPSHDLPDDAATQHLDALLGILPVGVWFLNARGETVTRNAAAEALTDALAVPSLADPSTVCGRWAATGVPLGADDWPVSRALMAGEATSSQLIDLVAADGSVRTVSMSATPVRDAAGAITGVMLVAEDATELHQARLERDQVLRDRAERMKELQTVHRVVRELIDDQCTLEHLFSRLVTLLPSGWQFPDLAAARIAIGDVAAASAGFANTPWMQRIDLDAGSGDTGVLEVAYLQAPPGDPLHPFLPEEDALLGTLAELISAHVRWWRAQAELARRDARFRALEAHSTTAVNVIDAAGNNLYASAAMETLFGYPPNSVVGSLGLQRIHPDGRPAAVAALQEAVERGSSGPHKVWALRADGVPFWAEMSLVNLVDDPAVAGIVISIRDITEREAAEQERLRQEQRFRTLVQSVSDVIVVADTECRLSYVSPSVALVLGYSPDELLGQPAQTLLHPDDIADTEADLQAAIGRPGSGVVSEARGIRKDGSTIWLEILSSNLLDDSDINGIVMTIRDVTQRKQAEEERERLDRRYRSLIEHSADVITIVDQDGVVLYSSPSNRNVLGYEPAERAGRPGRELIHPDDLAVIDQASEHIRDVHGASTTVVCRVRDVAGRWRVMETTVTNLLAEPSIGGIVVNGRDVTARREAEASVRFQAALLRAVGQAVVASDIDGNITYWNHAAELLYGWAAEDVLGRSAFDSLVTDDFAGEREPALQRLDAGDRWEGELRAKHRDGRVFPVLVTTTPLVDAAGATIGAISISTDISDRKALEEQLQHQAFHDSLTDLPNRALLLNRLDLALARAERQTGDVVLLYVDLDDFKKINDSFGHPAGDALLVEVGERIAARLRPGDTVARLGGDEFIVLLDDVREQATIDAIAASILDALSHPLIVEGQPCYLTASIGIAVADRESTQPHDLIRNADIAQYRAKHEGKARTAAFDPEMQAHAEERLVLERELYRAMERAELRVHYQPIVDLVTGETYGHEALMRWQHAERGLLFPGAFIPIAEETGLIIPMGSWLLEEACCQTVAWNRAVSRQHPLVISVNLSARQLRQRDLIEEVTGVLHRTGLPPRLLKLEITESMMMADITTAITTLRQLRQLGVQIAIDDFGTGYSSLAYLKRFPLDVIKIDRAFIVEMERDADDRALIQAIVGTATAMGFRTIAEGIETSVQAQMLQALGCDLGQGYLYARPLPADEAAARLS